jgi:hypothetical protein
VRACAPWLRARADHCIDVSTFRPSFAWGEAVRILGIFVIIAAAVVLFWPTIRGSVPALPLLPVDRALGTVALLVAGFGLLFVSSRAE